MNRITVYTPNGDGTSRRAGHFDLDAAERVLEERTRWDGQNRVGAVSVMQTGRAVLYRTKGGRWVENQDRRREHDGTDQWRFLTDDEARQWMITSGGEEADKPLSRWFPDTPDEDGPKSKGGRPRVGPTFPVAFPRDLLDRVDAAAGEAGLSRAAWIRQMAEAAVRD
ncbi:CopG family transcriptional regulator [Streptomyces sp. NPDC048241]|uniref:ribbon-helix-helix domain-containing protein n=1 Tax=Streptomyces sp. NPDC048241 TaxID=3365521 RepID=UPI00371926A5